MRRLRVYMGSRLEQLGTGKGQQDGQEDRTGTCIRWCSIGLWCWMDWDTRVGLAFTVWKLVSVDLGVRVHSMSERASESIVHMSISLGNIKSMPLNSGQVR